MSVLTEWTRVCPKCHWDFKVRRMRRCPGCGVLLLIPSDPLDLYDDKDFWFWAVRLNENRDGWEAHWEYCQDWRQLGREAMKKLTEYMEAQGAELLKSQTKGFIV